jgi:type II restriction enzyme
MLWLVRNLLLVPHFAFPPSAIIKRKPLSQTARRAGWVGCNFNLSRIPVEARIEIIITRGSSRRRGNETPSEKSGRDQSLLTSSPTNQTIIVPPEEVREKFKRIKPLKEISVTQRGWTLDVLNAIRCLVESRRRGDESGFATGNRPSLLTSAPTGEFKTSDVYAFERELAKLHPDT